MKRITPVFLTLALALVVWSCGGSSTLDNTEASVYLTVDVSEYNPDIDLCLQATDIAISSHGGHVGAQKPSGRVQQPTGRQSHAVGCQAVSHGWWQHGFARVDVRHRGLRSRRWERGPLENYRVYPYEFLGEVPLAYLLPENGGFDPETGNSNIRQSFELQLFGQTVSGKNVSTIPISIAFNFFCLGQ